MEVKPGYKQTEVGVIPKEWEVRTIGQMFRLINGCAFKPDDWKRSGTPIIRIQNLNDPSAEFNYSQRPVSERNSIEKGDLLFAWSGTLGSSFGARVWNGPSGVLNQHIFKVLMDEQQITLPFSLLVFARVEEDIAKQAHGFKASFVHVKKSDLVKVDLPLPLVPEQRAIATALSDVDGLLGGLDRLIAKKRDLKQAAMQQLLTGQTRLPGFHGEWEDAQVKDVIAGFFCGPSPTCEERNVHDDEWGVLKTTAATKEKGWDWTKHKTLPRVFWNKPHLELKKGDVIVTKAGPRHRVGVAAWVDYVPPRIIVSGKMIGLRPRPERVVSLILATAISARDAQIYLDQRTTGMAESQVNFENTALLEAPILIPRIEEQTAIAEVLTEMDAELAALEQRREKTRALKQAMMQELLTGKTRLVEVLTSD